MTPARPDLHFDRTRRQPSSLGPPELPQVLSFHPTGARHDRVPGEKRSMKHGRFRHLHIPDALQSDLASRLICHRLQHAELGLRSSSRNRLLIKLPRLHGGQRQAAGFYACDSEQSYGGVYFTRNAFSMVVCFLEQLYFNQCLMAFRVFSCFQSIIHA
jgi:hypothetical protein